MDTNYHKRNDSFYGRASILTKDGRIEKVPHFHVQNFLNLGEYWSLILASNGFMNGDPQKIYKEMSCIWIKKCLDYIIFKNEVKNINFEKK